MTWLNSLKIAIIEENITQIDTLVTKLPDFESKDRAKEALALISESIKIVNLHKSKTLESMNKLKKTKAFLESN
jgi:hypothetical protein